MIQSNFSSHNNTAVNYPPPDGKLVIFSRTIAVYKLWHDWLKNLPKHSRYTVGSRLDQTFLDLLELLFSAIYLPKDKKMEIAIKSVGKIDLLKFYLRLCWEMQLLDNNKFQILAVKMEEIGRMAWTWKNNLEKTSPPMARTEK